MQYVVNAKTPEFDDEKNPFIDHDPFLKNWDDLKALAGLDKNFKRRSDRIVKNYDVPIPNSVDLTGQQYLTSAMTFRSGNDGARSKEINPGTVYRNGYGLFDVITPPWNLYELANYYDTSFANHAAIDAKVENIVGLGYDFDISKRTLMRLEDTADLTASTRAKRRIERAKVEMREWLETLNDDESFTQTLSKFYTDVQSTGNGYLEIGRTTTGEIGYVGHIPATTMRVRRLRDGYVQIIGQKVVYFRNFGAKNQNPVTGDPRPN